MSCNSLISVPAYRTVGPGFDFRPSTLEVPSLSKYVEEKVVVSVLKCTLSEVVSQNIEYKISRVVLWISQEIMKVFLEISKSQ